MRARPELVEIIIEKRILRWCRIARMPDIDPQCPPWRARKNFWRLCKTYPETAKRLGLCATSVYDR
jgi:hypothetical protein